LSADEAMPSSKEHFMNTLIKIIKKFPPPSSLFILLFIVFTIHYSLSTIHPLYAAFEDISVGGRPAAFSGAYTAVEGDAYSIYYNPAALAGMARAEFGAQYSKLHTGLTDGSELSNAFFGVAQPLKFGSADYGTIGAGWIRFDLAELYQENTIILSWARDIVKNKLSFGFGAKMLSITYGENDYTKNAFDNEGNTTGAADPLFNYGYIKSAADFDAGIRYAFAKNYAVAAVAQNLAGANISLVNDPNVALPRRYRFGLAHTGKAYALSADVAGASDSSVVRGMVGVEKSFDFGGALRAGLGMGTDGWANIAGGFGFKADALSFDYGLAWPLSGIKNTSGSHRVSVNFKFGPVMRHPESDSETQVRLAQEITARKEYEQKYRVSEIELARAREEIRQLKNQIEELLKRPSAPIPAPREIASPKPTVTETPAAVKPGVTPAAPAMPTDIDALRAAYAKEFNQYQRDASKMDIKQRIAAVDVIVARYQGKIKITEAVDEQMILRNEFAAQTKFYNDALTYYKRLVRQGISVEERKDILNRMITKYQVLGVDVTVAKEELKTVK
jgi:hypothetical protein